MNRRDFLKFLLASASASYVDYEKLLWIPGEKTIFLPPVRPGVGVITESQIIALEMERFARYLPQLFERDAMFYAALTIEPSSVSRRMHVPLEIRPGRTFQGWDFGREVESGPRFHNTRKGRGPYRVSKADRD